MKTTKSPVRFYVQCPHVAGCAVIDRKRSTLVVSGFGDSSEEALRALRSVAAALNAATAPFPSMYASDTYKAIHPPLAWRVVEYLAAEHG